MALPEIPRARFVPGDRVIVPFLDGASVVAVVAAVTYHDYWKDFVYDLVSDDQAHGRAEGDLEPAEEPEYIYRVVNRNGNPASQAWPRRGMQNAYYDKASAKRTATRTNGRVQYSATDWRDLDE